jgi:hypothetical protein
MTDSDWSTATAVCEPLCGSIPMMKHVVLLSRGFGSPRRAHLIRDRCRFLLRATPRHDLAGWTLRAEANLTAAGHSRDTPDQTPDPTQHRHVVASHPPSVHSVP